MDLKEAAKLLSWDRESVKDAIENGVQLPKSGKVIKIACDGTGKNQIAENALDEFLAAFEAEEPGRHPPIAVRRALRIEACHKCAICRSDLPLQFHHILEWSELKHHDESHMLAICGGCHDKIGTGQIDRTEQRKYKQRLQEQADLNASTADSDNLFHSSPSSALLWDDVHAILQALHDTVVQDTGTTDSQFDFTIADVEKKALLNKLGMDTFEVMLDRDEPYFGRIQAFLGDPRNETDKTLYHETVDELRRQIASRQADVTRFDDILLQLHAVVCDRFAAAVKGRKRTLRILISFMFFNCDIGRKE